MTQIKLSSFNIGRQGIPPSQPVSTLTCTIYINSHNNSINKNCGKSFFKTNLDGNAIALQISKTFNIGFTKPI